MIDISDRPHALHRLGKDAADATEQAKTAASSPNRSVTGNSSHANSTATGGQHTKQQMAELAAASAEAKCEQAKREGVEAKTAERLATTALEQQTRKVAELKAAFEKAKRDLAKSNEEEARLAKDATGPGATPSLSFPSPLRFPSVCACTASPADWLERSSGWVVECRGYRVERSRCDDVCLLCSLC